MRESDNIQRLGINKNLLIIILLFTVNYLYCKNYYVDYVDTKIGVFDKRGSNCVIGPQLPYGSILPSPQTKDGSHDGYNYQREIRGFGQLHVSGTGWGKYGHFLISPQVGLRVGVEDHDSPKSAEITKAYFYQTNLDRYGIVAAVSPTHHAALYQFSFPQTDSACILLDATQSIADIVKNMNISFRECKVTVDPEKRQIFSEIDVSGGWGRGSYKMFFVAEFNKLFEASGVWKNNEIFNKNYEIELSGNSKQRLGAFVQFKAENNEKILLKVAISFSGFDNALKYLATEIPNWDIQTVALAGKNSWEKKLRKITIETNSEEQKKIFYTALYHTMIQPRDRTGDNPKAWPGNQPYWDDNYAIWDTWRTTYPLLLLVDPDMVRSNIQSFMDRLKQNGCVYDGFIAGNDMKNEQGGNNVDNVIADAYVKGLTGIDWKEAYEILKNNADNNRKGISLRQSANHDDLFYRKYGWLPFGNITSSYTLEYNYNDFCAATMAKGLGKMKDYAYYLERSKGWKNLWDSTTNSRGYYGFVGSKSKDGDFVEFDYEKHPDTWSTPFYEANSWTYSLFIPHDIDGMIQKMGGKKQFAERLDFAFKNELIAYWNEPAFLAIRLLNHADRPDLAAYWTHRILSEKYDITGYPENDDTGAMSSWYVFSALGIFPNAGQDIYYLNAPIYKKSVIKLENRNTITIKATNVSKENIYIKSCKINNKVWNKPIIHHSDIANGVVIEFDVVGYPTEWSPSLK